MSPCDGDSDEWGGSEGGGGEGGSGDGEGEEKAGTRGMICCCAEE